MANPKWMLKTNKKIELDNVAEPNLLRDQFPYSEPPKIAFDGVEVPIDPPEDIFITDTTFRDGQQARTPYTVDQIVDLYDLLHRLSGPNGVIRQSEFFLYSEKDRKAVEKCLERGYKFPEVTGWIRAVASDFKLVKDMGLRETGILTSASDYHIYLKLGWDRKKALDNYLGIVKAALEAGVKPRCHFEDVTRADIYGFVVPFAIELMKLAEESKVPIKVRLCDTMGYGVPYAGATLPRSVPRLAYAMVHDAGVPKEQLEWHGHNDFYKVLINASTAWLYGVAGANGTLLGFGERTGNTPIEGLIFEYAMLTGSLNGADPTAITDIANYLRENCAYTAPVTTPFVGENFNVTAAGIHADGVVKNEEIYNIFDTARLLNRPLGINITDKSGSAAIAFWVNQYLKLSGDQKIDKRHPGIDAIYKWTIEEFSTGRTTSLSTEEMLAQGHRHLSEYFK